MPAEYRHHLALYEGISTEHSSIDDIVQKARQLEKTLMSLKSGRGADRQPIPALTPAGSGQIKGMGSRDNQRSQIAPTRSQRPRTNMTTGAQTRCPTQNPPTGDRGKATTPNTSALRSNTSKLSCYRCGKVGHIASDPKCLQYKKPEQRQIFAAQVLDDRSDGDQPDQVESTQDQEQVQEPEDGEILAEGDPDRPSQDDLPDGSQYDNEEPSYDEYEGYKPPSDDEELKYIRAMSDEASTSSPLMESSRSSISSAMSATSSDITFENQDWQPHLEALRACYQHVPWVCRATWEFTPHDGITHICNCEWCTKYKEHLVIAEAMTKITHDPTYESAWKTHDQYEQKLIRLEWDLAHEGG